MNGCQFHRIKSFEKSYEFFQPTQTRNISAMHSIEEVDNMRRNIFNARIVHKNCV